MAFRSKKPTPFEYAVGFVFAVNSSTRPARAGGLLTQLLLDELKGAINQALLSSNRFAQILDELKETGHSVVVFSGRCP
jgi:hypothetical protein